MIFCGKINSPQVGVDPATVGIETESITTEPFLTNQMWILNLLIIFSQFYFAHNFLRLDFQVVL
jgi:hypothetical protein